MTSWQKPSKDEFDANWLTPEEAIDQLCDDRLERQNWEHWILERLRVGLIIAVGRTGDPKGKLEEFPPVLPRYWRSWEDYPNRHFWLTGDAKFTVDFTTGYDGKEIRYFDVRLDPNSFNGRPPKSAPNDEPDMSAPQVGPTRRQELPLLPDSVAQAWADWFKRQPGANKDSAEREARHMFPNHNFSRDRIRDLMGPSVMGRPRNTGE